MYAIEVNNLSKSYDKNQYVLKDITFSIPKGEVFGFLGPNGAGKTTLIRVLNGILDPTEGKGKIFGDDIVTSRKNIRSICGVMTENAGLYESLSAKENLHFFGSMFNMKSHEIESKSSYLLSEFKLLEAKDKKVKTFSTGMKKRLSLARTLLHSPKILFLDEPTSGLDPESSKTVLDLIKRMAVEQEVTVFLCTHQLKYAEEICTLYGFIDKGKLLGFGTFQELLSKKDENITLEIKGEDIPSIYGLQKTQDDLFKISINNEKDIPNILAQIINQNGKIYEAKQVRWNLEDLYFAYQRGEGNE
ncbi:ABC transporter ATP-binding protein [Gottschalkia purinilytica]|uniref:ABC transporter ATP-binding protein n=1 Tax=Gottschalkia purinilytica TaxID=1503 RepID=A0A0L0WA40_GOTPU|nr:ABC transporter ATP-binding protein [Gottschalkia purinilytica]KNF08302.1 ABC transporter ATP-binding protein [Gottschalkia purinilytica]